MLRTVLQGKEEFPACQSVLAVSAHAYTARMAVQGHKVRIQFKLTGYQVLGFLLSEPGVGYIHPFPRYNALDGIVVHQAL